MKTREFSGPKADFQELIFPEYLVPPKPEETRTDLPPEGILPKKLLKRILNASKVDDGKNDWTEDALEIYEYMGMVFCGCERYAIL